MDNIILTIITSAAMSGFITALFGYIAGSKKNSLEHITNERRAWCEETREIAKKIPDADRSELQRLLTSLKLRINPYGKLAAYDNMKSKKYNVSVDGHIWACIQRFEAGIIDEEHFWIQKRLLSEYLGGLLKFEWERCKAEVKDYNYAKVANVLKFCGLFGLGLLSYCVMYWNRERGIWFVISFFAAAIITVVLPCVLKKITADDVATSKKLMNASVSFIFLVLGLVPPAINRIYVMNFRIVFTGCCIIIGLGFFFSFLSIINTWTGDKDYENFIIEITKTIESDVESKR